MHIGDADTAAAAAAMAWLSYCAPDALVAGYIDEDDNPVPLVVLGGWLPVRMRQRGSRVRRDHRGEFERRAAETGASEFLTRRVEFDEPKAHLQQLPSASA